MSELFLVLVAPTYLLPPESIGSTAEPQGREFCSVHDAQHTYLFTRGAFLFPMMRLVCQRCWNWTCKVSSLHDDMVTFSPTGLLKLLHIVMAFIAEEPVTPGLCLHGTLNPQPWFTSAGTRDTLQDCVQGPHLSLHTRHRLWDFLLGSGLEGRGRTASHRRDTAVPWEGQRVF